MGVVHGLNPYNTIPILEPHSDPSFVISNWHHLISPYGPLFTLYTYGLVPLGVHASFWVLKLTLALFSLGTLWLVWRCAQLLGRPPLTAVLFVGLNPVVLIWGLGGDHNDFMMLFFILLSFYLLLLASERRREAVSEAPTLVGGAKHSPPRDSPTLEIGAGAALVAAAAIKASAGILLPIVILGAPRRLRVLLGVILGGLVFGAMALVAFGAHLPDLAEQGQLVTALSLPNLLGLALFQGGETNTIHSLLSLTLFLGVVGCSLWAWRTGNWLSAAGTAVLVLLLTLSWELPWYVLWLLPFGALVAPSLDSGRRLRKASLLLGVYLIAAWLPTTGSLLSALHLNPGGTSLAQQHARLTRHLLH
jgi:hypothetical protein